MDKIWLPAQTLAACVEQGCQHKRQPLVQDMVTRTNVSDYLKHVCLHGAWLLVHDMAVYKKDG